MLANLVRPLLLEVAANLQRVPDRLIISGLEGDEPDEVVPAFARHGLREVARRSGDNWSGVESKAPVRELRHPVHAGHFGRPTGEPVLDSRP